MIYKYASADEIALAVVTAARLTDENPLDILDPRLRPSRAKVYALAALWEAFPQCSKIAMTRGLGFGRAFQNNALAGLNAQKCRRDLKWHDEYVDEIVGVLVGENYEPTEEFAPTHGDAA